MGGFVSRRQLAAGLVLLATALAGLQAPAADAAPRKAGGYRIVELPFPAIALNDNGMAVGNVGPESSPRAATWRNGHLRVLPLPAGATESVATSVNDHGIVGGYVQIPGTGRHAVVWANGRPRLLPEAEPWDDGPPSESYVQAVNDRDVALGAVDFGLGWFVTAWRGVDSGRPWAAGGGGKSNPRAFNDHGLVVGTDGTGMHAARWAMFDTPTTWLRPLNPDGEAWSFAWDINNAGQVLGIENAEYPVPGGWNEFVVKSIIWDASGVPTEIPQPTDGGSASAAWINNHGLIVGTYTSPNDGASEVAYWAGSRVVRTGIAGYPVDLNDKGAMIVRDGSRSLLVTPWQTRGVRSVAPVTVQRAAGTAQTAQGLGGPQLGVLRRQACVAWTSPRPCPLVRVD